MTRRKRPGILQAWARTLAGRVLKAAAYSREEWMTLFSTGVGTTLRSDIETPEDAYKYVSWVQIAISAITEAALRCPLEIYRLNKRQAGTRGVDLTRPGWSRRAALIPELDMKPVANPIQLLQDPMRDNSATWLDLFEQSSGWYHLRGRLVWYCPRGAKGIPLIIAILNPDRLRAKLREGTTAVDHYEYYTAKGVVEIPQEDVMEIMRWDPTSATTGLSPLESAMKVANSDAHQVAWNESLAKHGYRVPGLLSTDLDITEAQAQQISDSFSSKYGGSANAWRVPVLGAGVKWQSAGLTPAEAEWAQTRINNRIELGAIYRVPPILMGEWAASYFNSEQQLKLFWNNAVLPWLRRFKLLMDAQFLPAWDKDLVAEWNLDGIEELTTEARMQSEVDRMYLERRVLSPGEVRQRTFGLAPYVGSSVIYGPLTEQPIADTDKLERLPETQRPVGTVRSFAGELAKRQAPDPEPEHDPDPVAELARYTGGDPELLRAMLQRALEHLPAKDEVLEVLNTPDALARYSRLQQALMRPALTRVANLVRSGFRTRLLKEVARILADGHTAVAEHLNLDKWAQELADNTRPFMRAWYSQTGERALAVSGKAASKRFDFAQTQRRWLENQVDDWAKQTADATVREAQAAITANLQAAAADKLSNDALIERLGSTLNSEYRAEMASRTLVQGSTEAARDEGWRQSGRVPATKWLTAPDDGRNRTWHLSANGQTVPLGQEFKLVHPSGRVVKARYPGDFNLPLKDRINCRCTRTAVLKMDETVKPTAPDLEPSSVWGQARNMTQRQASSEFYGSMDDAKWGQSLTEPQAEAVRRYQTHRGEEMLRHARQGGGSDDVVRWTRDLESALARSDAAMPEATVVYRGCTADVYATGSQPLGTILHDRGFISASYRRSQAANYTGLDPERLWAGAKVSEPTMYRILVPKGMKAPAIDGSNFYGQHEVLLPRNTAFRIVRTRTEQMTVGNRTGPVRVIDLEVVE